MTLALAGELALWVALLFAIWGVVVSAAGSALARADLAASGTRAMHATGVMLALALLVLATALFRRELGLTYVAAFGGITATGREMVVALWAAPPGALLVLGVMLAAVGSIVTHAPATIALHVSGARAATWSRAGSSPDAAAAMQLVLLGVIATLLASDSPFVRLSFAAGDGRGLPPHMREPISLLVWPLWAAAVGAAAATFALGIAAALGGSAARTRAARGEWYAMTAWLLHSAALLSALWWSRGMAAGEDGWIARALDPVSVLAWLLLGTAAHLTSLEHRHSLGARARTTVLALPLPVLLLSAMLAEEGGWQPLHELAHGVGGAWWIVLMLAMLQVLVYVLVRLRAAPPIDRARESTSGALATRLTFAGLALLIVGLAASRATSEAMLDLRPGERRTMRDVLGREWGITFQGLSVRERRGPTGDPRWRELLLPVAMARSSRGGRADETLLVSEVREHVDVFGRPTAPAWPRPAVRREPLQDLVVEPDSIGDGEEARLRVAFVPLAGLVWLGGAALLVGGATTLVARRR